MCLLSRMTRRMRLLWRSMMSRAERCSLLSCSGSRSSSTSPVHASVSQVCFSLGALETLSASALALCARTTVCGCLAYPEWTVLQDQTDKFTLSSSSHAYVQLVPPGMRLTAV